MGDQRRWFILLPASGLALGVFLAFGSDASPLVLAAWIAATVVGQMLEVPAGPEAVSYTHLRAHETSSMI